jgi:hypothetical protein
MSWVCMMAMSVLVTAVILTLMGNWVQGDMVRYAMSSTALSGWSYSLIYCIIRISLEGGHLVDCHR